MERLTHIDHTGWYVEDQSVPFDERRRGKDVDRLAAYEDTGLEPEEVHAMKNAVMGQEIAKITEFDGIPIQQLQELARAEKEGRLAVLPCRVGDIVFDILDGTPYETGVISFSYFGDHWACRTVSSYPDLEVFGERIFLTREEAEAALKKREGHCG